ncbi:hypothetical protein V5F59_08535 [Xanthobacter autotrophicus DSM 431]|uniref:hypothetical protein n=1 Tax=Xanthobacter nonsaccharivorans TaxID=3119912 RepID=UPI00372CB451
MHSDENRSACAAGSLDYAAIEHVPAARGQSANAGHQQVVPRFERVDAVGEEILLLEDAVLVAVLDAVLSQGGDGGEGGEKERGECRIMEGV